MNVNIKNKLPNRQISDELMAAMVTSITLTLDRGASRLVASHTCSLFSSNVHSQNFPVRPVRDQRFARWLPTRPDGCLGRSQNADSSWKHLENLHPVLNDLSRTLQGPGIIDGNTPIMEEFLWTHGCSTEEGGQRAASWAQHAKASWLQRRARQNGSPTPGGADCWSRQR